MKTQLSILVLALLGLSVLACGSGGSTLAAAVADGGDATTSDALTTDDALSSDAPADAVVEAGTDAPVGQVDATAVEAGNAAASDAGDAGNNAAEAGPYMGSLATPATSALIRFANWSADSPAFDMCIAPHGTTSFQGPLLLALAAATGSDAGSEGLAFPLVSAYTLVPPGQYDARIIVGGAVSCAVGIRADTTDLPILAVGGAETVALAGEVVPSATDYKLHVLGLPDDVSAGGSAEVRVINAAPAMPFVDFGTGSLSGGSFLAIFREVQVGYASTPKEGWTPALVDTNGYNAGKPISSASFSGHNSGATMDAVVSPSFSVPNGVVMTFIVAGGTSSISPALVACADNAGTAGVLSDCNVLVAAGM
jgi:hypothetical protein